MNPEQARPGERAGRGPDVQPRRGEPGSQQDERAEEQFHLLRRYRDHDHHGQYRAGNPPAERPAEVGALDPVALAHQHHDGEQPRSKEDRPRHQLRLQQHQKRHGEESQPEADAPLHQGTSGHDQGDRGGIEETGHAVWNWEGRSAVSGTMPEGR